MNKQVELLARYNEWRRGDGDINDMPASAKEIGKAIDAVIGEHYELLESLEKLHSILSKGGVWTIEDQEAASKGIAKAKGDQR